MADQGLGSLVARLAADLTDLKRGLLEGKAQLAGFQQFVEEASGKVKKLLALGGISLGLYELVSQAREFGRSILEEGAKIEVLKASAAAVGRYYEVSGAAIDLYVQKIKAKGVEEEKAYYAVNAFLKSGLSLDLLPQLAGAAKNLAPSMAMPFNEAFEQIIQGIVKGTPKQLAELAPGIKQVLQAVGNESKKLLDETVLSAPERAQIMLDYVLEASRKAEGAGAAVADSYMAKMGQYKRLVKEAKEALFEFVKPVSLAVTGVEMQSWQDLLRWITLNREQLAKLSELITIYMQKGVLGIKSTIDFAAAHKDLFRALLEVWGVLKVLKFIGIAEGAAAAAVTVGGLTGKLAALRLALTGPWGLVIAVTVMGLYEATRAIDRMVKKKPSVGTSMLMGEAQFAQSDADRAAQLQQDQRIEAEILEDETFQKRLKAAQEAINKLPPEPQITEEEARRQVRAGAAKGRAEGALPGGGGGRGGKSASDSLLAPTLAMYKTLREVELQAAQNSLDLLKSSNEKKRAELERALSEGLIDGQNYYQGLQDLQRAETAAALAMIEQKRQAQQKGYRESLAELEADPKLSPEGKDIARRKLEAEQRKALAKLDTEAAQVRLEDEKKITDELRRQAEVRKEYRQKTEDMNLETAQLLGAISEQEAQLQRFSLEWQRATEAAIKARAYTPEYAAALDANYRAKAADASPWAEKIKAAGQILTGSLGDLAGNLWDSGVKFSQACDQLGKKVLKDTFKLFFDDLAKAFNQGIKSLASSISKEMSGGGGGGFESFFSGIGKWFSGLFSGGSGGDTSWLPSPEISAHGNVYHQGVRLALAHGGVLTRPTYFPLARGGTAVAGEAGLEAAFAPLTRIGNDLGVKALYPRAEPQKIIIEHHSQNAMKGTVKQDGEGNLRIVLDEMVSQTINAQGLTSKELTRRGASLPPVVRG